MELDGRKYPAIDDDGYRLPQDLHKANPSEACASPLGYHHHRLLGTRSRKFSSPEGRLYDGDDLLPFLGSESFSRVSAQSHTLRCSDIIPDGPPSQCSCIHRNASEVSSSPGIFSYTEKGAISMGIICPGGGTWAYRSARSAVRLSRDTCAGGKGLFVASMYHPIIRTHAYLTRGRSDARRDSILRLASSVCLLRSLLRPARIRQMSFRTVHWAPSWNTVTLASMATQVSPEIQSCITRSCRVGLGI